MRIAALTLTVALAVSAAQTRTNEIHEARDLKVRQVQPETVSSMENLLLQLKERRIIERITSGYHGLRTQFGGMPTGSGFAFGPQFFREDLAGGRIRVNASALVSTRSWHKYEAGIVAPHLARNRVSLALDAGKRDYRSLDFYGIGPDSKRTGRTAYGHQDTFVEGTLAFRPARYVSFGSSVGGLWVSAEKNNRQAIASTEAVFNDSSAPGLYAATDYLRNSVFGQVDYRDNPAGPKAGGNYVLEYSWYNDQSTGAFSFRRWDIDLQQYIAVFNNTRRLALRARMSMTDPSSGDRVPFYLQPRLGGADDLRGFRPFRFTDRNAVLYNAEYRWEVFSGLDGALFFDAGKVMPHRGHLSFADLEVSPGFGLRFNVRNQTFIRLDAGFSHEGACVWLKFNDAFLPRLFGAGTRQPRY